MSTPRDPMLKKFKVQFQATIYGEKIIEAFDEEDARDQFSVDSIHDFDGDRINAEIDEVFEVTKTGKRKKVQLSDNEKV